MANIQGQKKWSDVRLLETHELARGGVNGNLNEQAKALADRTELLMEEKASKTEINQGIYEFGTYAEFNALKETLPANCSVIINEEPVGTQSWAQGYNRWNGSILTKSIIDPVTPAKNYINTELNKLKNTGVGKNKYNPAGAVADKYIGSNGTQYDAAGWKHSGAIPVTAGKTYTLSANANKANTLAFYSTNVLTAANAIQVVMSEGVTPDKPYTFTVPAGAAYVAFNVKSTSLNEPSQIQLEYGSVATTYEVYNPNKTSILPEALPETVVVKKDLEVLTASSYEKKIISPNLFNVDKDIVQNSYVGTNGSIQSAAGWTRSAMIAVTAGKTYTLSGSRNQPNIGFYATSASTTSVGVIADNPQMPITFTVPSGAAFVSFNIASASNTAFSDLQLEEGSQATTYRKEVGEIKLIKSSYFDDYTGKSILEILGNEASIKVRSSELNVTLNLILKKSASRSDSQVFNFKSESVGVVTRNLGDDVSPYGLDGTLVGANHGYAKYALTVPGHGKTTSDIGSVWSDGSKEWVITRIIDTNTLDVTIRARSGVFASGSTLTHVSGASNTAPMTTTAAVSGQLYPSTKNHKITMSIDDQPINIQNGSFTYKKNVTFHESYEIIDKLALVEWIIANKGGEILQYGGAAAASVTLDHRFDVDGGYSAAVDFLALQNIPSFQDIMFGQSVRFGANSYFYVPKTLPFTQGATTYNLTNLTQASFAAIADFDSAKTEASGLLADRIIQHDATHTAGFALGMLPILDAGPNKRRLNAVNKALRISSAMKSYLYVIDGAKSSLNAGDYFSAVIYRKHFKVGSRTAQYPVRSRQGDYLYLDWHGAVTERVEVPADYTGRSFEVIEKSSNVTLFSTASTSSIPVKVDSSKSYGYAVLKFS